MGIEKSRTTPYHPMGNGVCERFNQTLLKMLGTLENSQKHDWKSYIAPLVHSYNCMKQETTNQSPFFLMFGREPRLPVDIIFGTNRETTKPTLKKYIDSLKTKLQESHKLAQEHIAKSQQRQKQNYDLRVRAAFLQPGDRVLVKIVAWDGKHKLSDKWEEEPYLVHKQPNPDVPVYIVRKENDQKHQRTLHRNLLLPIGYIENFNNNEDSTPTQKERPTPMPRKSKRLLEKSNKDTRQPSDSSDSEDELYEVKKTEHIAHSDNNATVSTSIPSTNDSTNVPSATVSTAIPSTTDSITIPSATVSESVIPTASENVMTATAEREQQQQVIDSASRNAELPSQRIDDEGDALPQENQGISGTSENLLGDPVRKSSRTRRKPQWMTGGEFHISNQQIVTQEPEWQRRADYLQSVAATGVFNSMNQDVAKALLNIVTGKT